MKSTDLARKERDLKKAAKKVDILRKKGTKGSGSVGDYINDLHDLFFFDATKIYNIDSSEEIFELLEEIKLTFPEKQWANIVSKAVKKTKIAEKESAISALISLGDLE